MNVVTVKINGKNVNIPSHEIPPLIQRLTLEYSRLLTSGRVSGAPREGYVTYNECEQVLSAYYADRMLRYHAGRLWGAMWRLTQYREGGITFGIICTMCGANVGPRNFETDGCYHYSTSTSVGYRMNIISRSSIIANFDKFMGYRSKTIGDSIKQDFLTLVESLRKE